MLVPKVHPISGEMLAGGRYAVGLDRPDKHPGILQHPLRVTAEGAYICDGVAEIVVNVHHRGEGPVYACAASLGSAHFGECLRAGQIVRSRYLEL